MRLSKSLLAILVFNFTLLCVVGQAQGSCICKITFLKEIKTPTSKLYLFDGTKYHLVKNKQSSFSEPITLTKGATSLSLTFEEKELSDKVNKITTATKIPSGATKIYVVVQSVSTKQSRPTKMHIVNASETNLKPGETLWMNLSDCTVKRKIGVNISTLMKQSRSITKDMAAKAGYYKVAFDYQYLNEEKFLPLLKKTWWHNPKSRYLGLIIGQEKKIPRVYKLQDRPIAESASDAP